MPRCIRIDVQDWFEGGEDPALVDGVPGVADVRFRNRDVQQELVVGGVLGAGPVADLDPNPVHSAEREQRRRGALVDRMAGHLLSVGRQRRWVKPGGG